MLERTTSLLAGLRRTVALWLLTVAAGTLPLGQRTCDASDLRMTPIVKAVQRVRPAVVNIQGEKTLGPNDPGFHGGDADQRVNGMGTGIVIDPRGYVLTNFHVVEGVERIDVTLADNTALVARLVSHDPATDLAIIKIDPPKPLPLVPIGTSSDLLPGEPVIAVGNAYGYENTVTRGIISALGRTVQVGDSQKYEDLIQTDASINPGNSGGPLLNVDGELIGVNVAVRVGAQGIGFAIPVDKAMAVAAELMSTKRLGMSWHGVVAREKRAGDDLAVVVASLEDGSPAAEAGLKEGDRIKSVAGEMLDRPLDFERVLVDRKVGDAIEVKVQRGQEEVTLHVTLAAAPKLPAKTESKAWELLGLELEPVPARQFQRYRSRYRGGLNVLAVRPGSPAARQGIRRGDVLVGMHIWETVTLDNVAYILNRPDFTELEPVKFYILRGNETLFGHLNVSAPTTR